MTQPRRYSKINDLADYMSSMHRRADSLLQIPNYFFDDKYAYMAEEGDKHGQPGIIATVANASDPLLLTPFDSFHQGSVSPQRKHKNLNTKPNFGTSPPKKNDTEKSTILRVCKIPTV